MSAVMQFDNQPEPKRSALATTTPADLLRYALDSGADLDRLEKLMDLQTRWEAQEAKKQFIQAMANFKGETIEILKRKQVRFESQKGVTEYKHAELADVCDAIVGKLSAHGLSHDWDVNQEGDRITVICTITHAAGHSKSVKLCAPPDASGGKNSIQAIGSTISYLERYSLLAATGLATKSTDDDGRAAGNKTEPMSEDHQATITSMCDGISPTTLRIVCKSYKVETLSQIPDAEYASIVKRLEITRQEKAA